MTEHHPLASLPDSRYSTEEARESPVHHAAAGSELYFGLVAPVGVDTSAVSQCVAGLLSGYGYTTYPIRLSSGIHPALGLTTPEYATEYERIWDLITKGDELCKKTNREDAVLFSAINDVQAHRDVAHRTERPSRVAYIFNSLKRKKEVRTLREIYGNSFFLVGIQDHLDQRIRRLEARFARNIPEHDLVEQYVQKVITEDREGGRRRLGQNVLETFPMADVFIDVSKPHSGEPFASLRRLLALLFGEAHDPMGTPSQGEFAMAVSYTAALRSASLSRRVGASLVDDKGQIVALGLNEVAKPGGAHYWAGDEPDSRDISYRGDYSKNRLRQILGDLITRLEKARRFSVQPEETIGQLAAELLDTSLRDSKLRDLIEFHRAVHAETSAILDAARRGVCVRDLTLYCTTYPCHLCMKEILAAGITRVVFIEPYPKSLAFAMYEDAVDPPYSDHTTYGRMELLPFVGIAPRRYFDLFYGGRSSTEPPFQRRKLEPLQAFQCSLVSVIQEEKAFLSRILPTIERVRTQYAEGGE